MEETTNAAPQGDPVEIRFNDQDMLKIGGLCFALSLLGCLVAIWLTRKKSS